MKHQTQESVIDSMLDAGYSYGKCMSLFRDALVHRALRRSKGNKSHAAKLLSVHRNTFTRFLPASEREARREWRRPTVEFRGVFKYESQATA